MDHSEDSKNKVLWGPVDQLNEHCRYLGEDGKYYNGYLSSPEAAEAAFGECFKKIAADILEMINNPDLWNEDGTLKDKNG